MKDLPKPPSKRMPRWWSCVLGCVLWCGSSGSLGGVRRTAGFALIQTRSNVWTPSNTGIIWRHREHGKTISPRCCCQATKTTTTAKTSEDTDRRSPELSRVVDIGHLVAVARKGGAKQTRRLERHELRATENELAAVAKRVGVAALTDLRVHVGLCRLPDEDRLRILGNVTARVAKTEADASTTRDDDDDRASSRVVKAAFEAAVLVDADADAPDDWFAADVDYIDADDADVLRRGADGSVALDIGELAVQYLALDVDASAPVDEARRAGQPQMPPPRLTELPSSSRQQRNDFFWPVDGARDVVDEDDDDDYVGDDDDDEDGEVVAEYRDLDDGAYALTLSDSLLEEDAEEEDEGEDDDGASVEEFDDVLDDDDQDDDDRLRATTTTTTTTRKP